MFVFSNFLSALAQILDTVLFIYLWVVIISALLSWVNPDPYNPIVRFLRNITEPVFYRIRKWIPFSIIGGIDLSPLFVIIAIEFLRLFLVPSLIQLGHMS